MNININLKTASLAINIHVVHNFNGLSLLHTYLTAFYFLMRALHTNSFYNKRATFWVNYNILFDNTNLSPS